MNIRHDHALGAIGQGTTVAAGATLEVQGGITVGDGLSLHGLGLADAGALRSLSGDNVWNGDVSLDSTRIAVDSDTLTITGQLSGSMGSIRLAPVRSFSRQRAPTRERQWSAPEDSGWPEVTTA